MKHPEIKLTHIVKNVPLYIRYGLGGSGKPRPDHLQWFFQVVSKYDENGYGFLFSTHVGAHSVQWAKYSEFLMTLPETRQKQIVRGIVKQLEDMLLDLPVIYGGIYKFSTDRLFVLIKRYKNE